MNIFSRRALYLPLLLAFALSMILVRNNLNAALAPDERGYLQRAQLVAADVGQDRAVFRPPFYPYTLALWFQTMGETRFSIGVLHALVHVVSIALVYRLTRLIFPVRAISFLAALAFAFSPQALSFVGTLLSESLFVVLMLAGIVFVLRAVKRKSISSALLGGILLALAALTREVIAYFALFVVPAWWIFFAPLRGRTRFVQAFVFLCGMILALTPWMIRNYTIESRLLLISTSSEYNFARHNARVGIPLNVPSPSLESEQSVRRQIQTQLAALPPNERAAYAYGLGFETIQNLGAYWLGYKAKLVGAFWNPFEFEHNNLGVNALPTPILPLASFAITSYLTALLVFATIGFIVAPDNASKLLLALFIVYSLALFILTHYQLRYRYPVYVLMLPYAAYGVWFIREMVRGRKWNLLRAPRFVLALLIVLLFVPLMGAP